MTAALFNDLLYSMGLLSLFLLLGVFLRAKIAFFGETFIPASVIGGFVLLILGPNVLNVLKIPSEWLNMYALIPGVLITLVVASVPLGLKLEASFSSSKNILPLAFIMLALATLQFAVGFLAQYIFPSSYNFYQTFGFEMGIGYVGGHGTAGVLGNMLLNANLPYWQNAQGVAITMATFGLVGGILLGMLLINIASRKGHTKILKNVAQIPQSYKIGYERDLEKQKSMGREGTLSASIDSLAFHLAIIIAVCAVAYCLLNWVKTYKIPILEQISIWAYAIVLMFIVWFIMIKLRLDFLVDDRVKSRISGTLTEFSVIAAIASLPIKAVFVYILPILFMAVAGFILTIFFLYFMCKWLLKDYWFEHFIAALGCCTGVFLTGILLLRIVDPDFKSPVMGNYSLSYTILSVIYFALLGSILLFILNKGLNFTLGFLFALSLAFSLVAIFASKFNIKGFKNV